MVAVHVIAEEVHLQRMSPQVNGRVVHRITDRGPEGIQDRQEVVEAEALDVGVGHDDGQVIGKEDPIHGGLVQAQAHAEIPEDQGDPYPTHALARLALGRRPLCHLDSRAGASWTRTSRAPRALVTGAALLAESPDRLGRVPPGNFRLHRASHAGPAQRGRACRYDLGRCSSRARVWSSRRCSALWLGAFAAIASSRTSIASGSRSNSISARATEYCSNG